RRPGLPDHFRRPGQGGAEPRGGQRHRRSIRQSAAGVCHHTRPQRLVRERTPDAGQQRAAADLDDHQARRFQQQQPGGQQLPGRLGVRHLRRILLGRFGLDLVFAIERRPGLHEPGPGHDHDLYRAGCPAVFDRPRGL
ncbi:hypothetical protein LTR94_033638, partial [Friedmanniomyces endolithicus]